MSDKDEHVVLCARATSSHFDDDVVGPCDGGCGASVCWRPHNRPDALHLCGYCLMGHVYMSGDAEIEIRVTAKTIEEAVEFFEAEAENKKGKRH